MAWVEGSPEEITAKLALLSDKLGHRLLEIRERAIASLNFKLSNDLMTFEDVGSDSGVLRALLDWFAHEDAVPTDDRALAMLRRIVEEEPTAAARLQNLGAEAALLEVADGRCSRQLAAQIESLVEKIASGGQSRTRPPRRPPRTHRSLRQKRRRRRRRRMHPTTRRMTTRRRPMTSRRRPMSRRRSPPRRKIQMSKNPRMSRRRSPRRRSPRRRRQTTTTTTRRTPP
jgi:hypothetical protein